MHAYMQSKIIHIKYSWMFNFVLILYYIRLDFRSNFKDNLTSLFETLVLVWLFLFLYYYSKYYQNSRYSFLVWCEVKHELSLLLPLKLGVSNVWFGLRVLSTLNWELDCWSDSSKNHWIETTTLIRLGIKFFNKNNLIILFDKILHSVSMKRM